MIFRRFGHGYGYLRYQIGHAKIVPKSPGYHPGYHQVQQRRVSPAAPRAALERCLAPPQWDWIERLAVLKKWMYIFGAANAVQIKISQWFVFGEDLQHTMILHGKTIMVSWVPLVLFPEIMHLNQQPESLNTAGWNILNILKFPISSNIIKYHPISSNIIQDHPISSNIIKYHYHVQSSESSH